MTCTDVFGGRWSIEEARPTRHGFDLLLGRPLGAGPAGKTTIITAALAEYLQSTERLRDVDLPLGRTAINRLRAALGLRFDWDRWWQVRRDDLLSLTLEQFCARHHCSMGAASQRRAAMRIS